MITITGGPQQADEQAGQVRLSRPVGIVVTHDGFLFVADEGAGRIIRIAPDGEAVSFAGVASGYADGPASQARFSGPAGIAVDREGNLYVADAQNLLIRRIAQVSSNSVEDQPDKGPEKFIQPADRSEDANTDAVIPRLSAAAVGAGKSFPWPLNPQNQWHEVAGVVGEARGAPGGIALDHLHAGLDVRGNMGEPAVSVLDEKTSSPISAWGFNDSSEGIRVGAISYIHIRVGRDATDRIQSADRFKPRLDQAGKLAGVRVRRGTRFRAGDVLGTLNRLFHVHMNFGPWSAIANPIEFPFVGFKDTVAPVIEPNGIEVVNLAGEPFKQRRDGRLVISGDVDVIVTAYDRVDGNVSSRKLGLYKAGYQLLKEGGATARGFDRPLINIEFNRLPPDDSAVFVVYGAGSGVSAYGTPTKFKYIVTNRVRDGAAQDGFLRTSGLDAGNYLLRVIAEDHSGNRASGKSTELAITIVK